MKPCVSSLKLSFFAFQDSHESVPVSNDALLVTRKSVSSGCTTNTEVDLNCSPHQQVQGSAELLVQVIISFQNGGFLITNLKGDSSPLHQLAVSCVPTGRLRYRDSAGNAQGPTTLASRVLISRDLERANSFFIQRRRDIIGCIRTAMEQACDDMFRFTEQSGRDLAAEYLLTVRVAEAIAKCGAATL